MTKAGRDVRKRALELPPTDRVKLAHDLLESVDDGELEGVDDMAELSDAWKAEIERRLADEPQPGKPWPSGEEVIARLRALEKKPSRKRRRGS
jgi:putative addiction module component (TIGR02574 family)